MRKIGLMQLQQEQWLRLVAQSAFVPWIIHVRARHGRSRPLLLAIGFVLWLLFR
jgi:hypothetical protein